MQDLAASRCEVRGKAISSQGSCRNVADKWVTNVRKIHRLPSEVDFKAQLVLGETTATLAAYFVSIYFLSLWKFNPFDPSGERKAEGLLQSNNHQHKIPKACKQNFVFQINYTPWHTYVILWCSAPHFITQI